jgi:hypothetical protein
MFWFFSLLLGFGGLGLFLVSMGLGIDFAWMGVDLCRSAIVALNLDGFSFRAGGWSHSIPRHGQLFELLFVAKTGMAMVRLGLRRSSGSNLSSVINVGMLRFLM